MRKNFAAGILAQTVAAAAGEDGGGGIAYDGSFVGLARLASVSGKQLTLRGVNLHARRSPRDRQDPHASGLVGPGTAPSTGASLRSIPTGLIPDPIRFSP
ncbi:MAG: hypothetical protein ACR2M4_10300 [Actinomycetota bacterium]